MFQTNTTAPPQGCGSSSAIASATHPLLLQHSNDGLHRLPLKQFVATFRGRVLSSERPLEAAKVISVGFLISDKQDGPFQLEVEWIKVALPPGQ